MVTLYVLPCDNQDLHNPERAKASFGSIVTSSRILDKPLIDDLIITVTTPWFAYIYSDEHIDGKLREALPVFLAAQYDCLVLMKKKLHTDGEISVYQSPRVFRRGVQIKPGLLIPKAADNLQFERILDGWIRE